MFPEERRRRADLLTANQSRPAINSSAEELLPVHLCLLFMDTVPCHEPSLYVAIITETIPLVSSFNMEKQPSIKIKYSLIRKMAFER